MQKLSQKLFLDTYMLYLTLWDKISQNLAHLEANSHKIFQISQNFQTILQHILWRNKHDSHFNLFKGSSIIELYVVFSGRPRCVMSPAIIRI